jgi:hypothetical protein
MARGAAMMRVTSSMRLMAGCCLAYAAMAPADDAAFLDAAPLAEAVLEEVRGGIEIPGNLHASFKLQRTAYLNGERIVDLGVDIPDIANMTAGQASALAQAAGAIVIQNGPDNAFAASGFGAASTVVQNTLSDQHLVTLTTLSVEVNSLGAFRELNFQEGVSQALSAIGGVR